MTTISVKEAADIIGVSEATVRRMCVKGELSAKKVGLRTWVINKASAEVARRQKK